MKGLDSSNRASARSAALPTTRIGGVPVGRLTRAAWAEHLVEDALARRGRGKPPAFYTSLNGQVLSLYHRMENVRAAIDAADGVDADGMSLVFASRLLASAPIPERCATTDFFHDVARIAARRGVGFHFLGGTEDANRCAAEAAVRLHPGLKILGRHHGYYGAEEEPGIVDAIAALKPDILWIGFGAPRQYEFVLRNRERLAGVGILKTCGGLFDFLSGNNRRAPRWMQDAGLEWLFRTALEPRRLAWRYLATNPHALYLMLRHR
jgi:exopolysaccharide biosynthesis WecB/TagA/CpsF family protein